MQTTRIAGLSVRDYAFQWASGGCPFQQWASGAIGVTPAVIDHAEKLLSQADSREDRDGLGQLVAWLKKHAGEPASKYVPE
jgi:hypothetical protein